MLDIPGALLQHFPLKGHLRSHYDVDRVAVRFLPITFDRNELETRGWFHSVRYRQGASPDMQHDL